MSHLPLLPKELLLSIANHLEVGSCKQVRLTCKALASVFAAKVLRSVKIDILDVDDYLDQLNLLACGQSKVPTHLIRILDIWSLSLANNSKYMNAGGSSRFKPVDKTAIEERITRALKPALQTLEQVHTLRWFPRVHDPMAAHQVVADVVSKYPSLTSLDINVSEFKVSVINSFHDLASIKYFCNQTVPANIVDGVAQAIAQSPRLHTLEVEVQTPDEPFDLHRLLSAYPLTGNPPLSLSHLSLYNCRPYIEPRITLPHIGTLTSLYLWTERSVWNHAADPEKEVQLERFWITLQEAAVHLERIVVDKCPRGLVNYLKSYSGLKCLKFHDNRRNIPGEVDQYNTTAAIFFQEALIPHCSILEELDVRQTYSNFWCFRKEYRSTLARCSNLKVLCIGISQGQVPIVVSHSEVALEANELHLLLNVIFNHCPVIQRITLKPLAASTSVYFGAFAGHHSAIFFRNFANLLNTSIGQYVAPETSKSFPTLHIMGTANTFNQRRFYEASRSASDNRIRFKTFQED
ncbi:hypothetical protein BJ165DRAFT_1450066 [Panaeolus papilionaceus]|nr:hypothetical protein BJ165DRAFT_1450066 [Panaeolus papilionaceus]